MKFLALWFLWFQVIQSVRSQDNCTSEYSCVNCIAVRICELTSIGYQELFRFNCPSKYPYCDASGSCSFLPTLACADVDTYPCPQEGTFPHPTDCSKFRVCDNGTSRVFQCPTTYNFDSAQSTCVSGASCYTILCSGKSGVKVPYYNDHSIYAYCLNEVAVMVERCPGSYQLDTTSQKANLFKSPGRVVYRMIPNNVPKRKECVPSCQSSGSVIPDASDCTKYYYCSLEPYATAYSVTSKQCPKGYGFEPRYLRCVPLKTLPSCRTGI